MQRVVEKKLGAIDKIRLYRPYIIALATILGIFIYIFTLIFGNKSLVVLLELREEKARLEESVKFYQKQNAYLQKEIFEIVGD